MKTINNKTSFIISASLHALILSALVLGLDFTSPLPVFENTNQHDVISAVVLGDTEKSKILPQKLAPEPPPPVKPVVKEEPKPKPMPKPTPVAEVKEAIPLKIIPKKKIVEKKPVDTKQQDLFAKALLDDIEKQQKKVKKDKPDLAKNNFQKTLREQAEKTMRQQLLNEEIKLQGTQARYSQGVVNKYQALIVQAISEKWIVPTGARKDISAEVMIRLAPGGVVLDVRLIRSSGDPSLDSSARAAIFKASPLPVPSKGDDFEPFRQFILKVKPENIVANSEGLGTL